MKSTDIIAHILQKDCKQIRGSGSSNQTLAEKGRFHKFLEARDMLKVECFYCKKSGHFKSECMKKKQDMKEGKKEKEDL